MHLHFVHPSLDHSQHLRLVLVAVSLACAASLQTQNMIRQPKNTKVSIQITSVGVIILTSRLKDAHKPLRDIVSTGLSLL